MEGLLNDSYFTSITPQYLCRVSLSSRLAPAGQKTFEKLQDMSLDVAAKFVCHKINPQFYQADQIPGSYPRLKIREREVREAHSEFAKEVLQKAFPRRHRELEARESRSKDQKKNINEIIEQVINGYIQPMEEWSLAEVPGKELVSNQFQILDIMIRKVFNGEGRDLATNTNTTKYVKSSRLSPHAQRSCAKVS
jgi:5-carboxymethyl-2-hydroxymuconate isomerase